MARDRAARERGEKRSQTDPLSNSEWLNAVKEEARRERSGKVYMQPLEASWREFMQHRGWTPDDIAELPDDWLYAEWGRYRLRAKYGIE